MAIGWISVLKRVPWAEVLVNAPKVADGAKKLWEAVGKKSAASREKTKEMPSRLPADASGMALLELQMADLGTEVADLQKEMIDSSRLIKALADQNAQLIRRVSWLTRAFVAVGLGALAYLFWRLIH